MKTTHCFYSPFRPRKASISRRPRRFDTGPAGGLLAAVLLTACGPRSPTMPESVAAAPATAAAMPVAIAARTVRLEASELDCVLSAQGGLVSAKCVEGTLTCVEVARADLAEVPGVEVVSRCDGPGADHTARGLVVANDASVLWVLGLDGTVGAEPAECQLPPTVAVAVVNPVPDALQELFVHQTDCESPGLLGDADSLWKFFGGEVRPVATAQVDCQWVGDTADPEAPSPPADQAYSCSGGYLAIDQVGGAWSVVRLAPQIEGYVGHARDAQGRLVLSKEVSTEALQWDGASGRFGPANP